jgi:hypothetical protein
MRKSCLILAALLVAFVSIAPAFAADNILASGEIALTAISNAVATTNSQTVSLYNSSGQEWGKVMGVRVMNNSAWTTVTSFAQTDLGGSTAIIAVTNANAAAANGNVAAALSYAMTVYSGTNDVAIYTNTGYYQSPPAYVRDLSVTVVTPSNLPAASTVEYYIYGE